MIISDLGDSLFRIVADVGGDPPYADSVVFALCVQLHCVNYFRADPTLSNEIQRPIYVKIQ